MLKWVVGSQVPSSQELVLSSNTSPTPSSHFNHSSSLDHLDSGLVSNTSTQSCCSNLSNIGSRSNTSTHGQSNTVSCSTRTCDSLSCEYSTNATCRLSDSYCSLRACHVTESVPGCVVDSGPRFFESRHQSMLGSDSVIHSRGGAGLTNTQTRCAALEQQIDKELRLRAGAEKLLQVTSSNTRLKDGICRELRIVNSNLQFLKEELSSLITSSTSVFNSTSFNMSSPAISLALKETKHVDFHSSLSEVLKSHYYVDVDSYRPELTALQDMRKASASPNRCEDGIEVLFSYYNQLYFVDRRFFPLDSSGPVPFVWYDSFTGLPCMQSTIGFEKGSILFNIAALYSQRGTKEMVDDADRLLEASLDLRRAAGAIRYLLDSFCNAPSIDMNSSTLEALIQLMCTQVQECEVRRTLLHDAEVQESQLLRTLTQVGGDIPRYIELAQESAKVTSMYDETNTLFHNPTVCSVIPPYWLALVRCKRQYFSALANWFIAKALTSTSRADDKPSRHFTDVLVSVDMKLKTTYSDQLVHDVDGRKTLARAHLRQAILACEESLSIACQYQRLQVLQRTIKRFHDRSMQMFSLLEEEDDFTEILLAPDICSKTKRPVEVIQPDFARYKVEDIFRRLGCIAIFSSRHSWTAPRTVTMIKSDDKSEFGFSVRGDSPVIVATVEEDSLAQEVGLQVGDFIMSVSGEDVKWMKHDKVVAMMRACSDAVSVCVVSPTDHNYIDPSSPPPLAQQTASPTDSISQQSTPHREPHWLKSQTMTYISDFKVKERPLSSFSWKLRKRRSQSKERLDSIRINMSSQSYS